MPKAPQPKTLETQPIALAWQPESRRHFAVGCVDGRVEIHSTKQAQPLARVWHGDRGAAFEVANEGAVRVDVAPSPRTTHGNPFSGRNGFAEIGVCMCEHGDEAPS